MSDLRVPYRFVNKKTRSIWKMLGPFATASHRTPPVLHCHSPGVATVVRRLRIDVHDNDDDNNDNAWQRGPLWPHRMGPTEQRVCRVKSDQVVDLLQTESHLYVDRSTGVAPWSNCGVVLTKQLLYQLLFVALVHTCTTHRINVGECQLYAENNWAHSMGP